MHIFSNSFKAFFYSLKSIYSERIFSVLFLPLIGGHSGQLRKTNERICGEKSNLSFFMHFAVWYASRWKLPSPRKLALIASANTFRESLRWRSHRNEFAKHVIANVSVSKNTRMTQSWTNFTKINSNRRNGRRLVSRLNYHSSLSFP